MGAGNLKRQLLNNRKVWIMGVVWMVVLLSAFNSFLYAVIPINQGNVIWSMAFQDTLPKGKSSKVDTVELRTPISVHESGLAQVAYMMNCHSCHGVDRMGASAPSLYNLSNRVSFNEFKIITSAGRAQMPGFRLLDEKTIVALYKYLSNLPIKKGNEVDKDRGKKP